MRVGVSVTKCALWIRSVIPWVSVRYILIGLLGAVLSFFGRVYFLLPLFLGVLVYGLVLIWCTLHTPIEKIRIRGYEGEVLRYADELREAKVTSYVRYVVRYVDIGKIQIRRTLNTEKNRICQLVFYDSRARKVVSKVSVPVIGSKYVVPTHVLEELGSGKYYAILLSGRDVLDKFEVEVV